MDLYNKYIKINLTDIDTILKYLYGKGYRWANSNSGLDSDTYNLKEILCENGGEMYIKFYDEVCFYYYVSTKKGYPELNIQNLIREDKLKRILK